MAKCNRKSPRLQNWDYGKNGAYFITICTKNQFHFFGSIREQKMILSEIGMIAHKFWAEIPLHYSFVKLGEWIIMPNHTHGIIIINKSQNHNSDHKCAVRTRHCLVPNTKNMTNKDKKITIGKSRFQNQGANTISSIIGNYKSIVTKNARKILPEFAWQARYYDHIIRTETAYENISNYIQNNPRNWRKDKF